MNENVLQIQLDLEVSEQSEEIELDVDEYVKDYNELINKPKLNGRVIVGDIAEEDPTVPAWAKTEKKPSYTPTEIGAVDGKNSITLQEIDEMFAQVFGK